MPVLYGVGNNRDTRSVLLGARITGLRTDLIIFTLDEVMEIVRKFTVEPDNVKEFLLDCKHTIRPKKD